jgi:hypothetical protein
MVLSGAFGAGPARCRSGDAAGPRGGHPYCAHIGGFAADSFSHGLSGQRRRLIEKQFW